MIESSKLLDNPAEPLSHSAAVCQPRSILEHLRAVQILKPIGFQHSPWICTSFTLPAPPGSIPTRFLEAPPVVYTRFLEDTFCQPTWGLVNQDFCTLLTAGLGP